MGSPRARKDIGAEIEALSEEIIPLADKVSEIEALQLEQAVELERAFRFGDDDGAHGKEQFETSLEKHEHLAKEVDRELEGAIKLLEDLPALDAEDVRLMGDYLQKLTAIGQHRHKFDRSILNPINRVIAGLNEGAEQVAAASGQVSTASQSLAEGASEQAASIEETSSSLEEMSSMTRQNADNAGQAEPRSTPPSTKWTRSPSAMRPAPKNRPRRPRR